MARSAGKKTTSTKKVVDDQRYLCPHCLKEKKKTDIVFRIEKISNSEGLVWLWCSSDNVGLVIRVF